VAPSAGEARRRLERELAPFHEFLDALAAYRGTFESWLAAAREQAGRFTDRIPPPPDPPGLPEVLEQVARGDDDAEFVEVHAALSRPMPREDVIAALD
jgi:hypothetical protein